MKKLSIYLMLVLAGLFMIACGPEDNEFAGLKKAEADGAVVIPGFNASELGVINLNNIEVSDTLNVQVFKISESALPEGVVLSKGEIVFADGTILPATADGKVSGTALSAIIAAIHGLRPEARTEVGTVYLYAVQNGAAVKINAGEVTFQVVPKAPEIESVYYFTGTLNGWDNGNTDYELSNGGLDPYEYPEFTMRLPAPEDGGDIEFKITPGSMIGTGDWSKCLASDGEGKFAYNNGGDGGNLKITAVEGAAFYKVTFNMLDFTYTVSAGFATPETWYLIGSCIGDGSWGNNSFDNVGTSLFPLARVSGTTISYTGYFTTDGFKLIKTPGSWNDQWGQGSNGYVKNDGGSGNITVPSAGYYTVTLNTMTDELTIEPANITPATYEVGMAGSFNGWSFEAMTRCPGNDHLWKAEMTLKSAEKAKFLIDGWSVNWGATDFPSGIGEQNGADIPLEKGNYIVIFNDITGGYNFIRTDAEEEPVKEPEIWYLIGSCIGDGSWDNKSFDNVGISLFPLACSDANTLSYTGYFNTDGFKLIKTPGSWDDQWGQGSDGYVKNDGGSGNITVPSAGYYTVTLNTATDQLTVVPADITPESYAVGVAGTFNGWSYQAIDLCPGSEHLWRAELTFNEDTGLKFLIDGWSVNWGAGDFPSGMGVQNGADIPVKSGSYIVVFNDITGGYNFIKK
jgi:hypothetical protein